MFLGEASPNKANNTVTNNLLYHDDVAIDFRVGSSYHSLSWVATDGNWHGAFGNVFVDNIIAPPSFRGGPHPVANLPFGFIPEWAPDHDGLALDPGSAARNNGCALGSPFNVDIMETSRPRESAWDIGAYEYVP